MLPAHVLAATLALVPAATAAITGTPCSADKDKFACEGTAFLACDSSTRTWNLQNNCVIQCTDPASGYASFCFQNSLPGGSNAPSSSASSPSSTTSAGQSTSRTGQNGPSSTSSSSSPPAGTGNGSQPDAQASSSGGLSTGAIIGISVCATVVAALIIAAVVVVGIRQRRSRSGDYGVPGNSGSGPRAFLSIARPNSKESTVPDVGTILEKKFVVTTDYEPSASDELRLRVGDSIVLDLLFNDGWAKGKNETTRQEGILPVACITQID
ncbi:hypothetical protein HK105_203002 [Polyrhizophydium stewartii]|uniref:SH3 domain-containing protein n=1 Tax=Polyrhizophydium stewartii TaxID=2732419 RepID=A0ABR4NCU0_9FUNG